MDPRDDEIDFDFFEDEPQTTEVQRPSRPGVPRRGGRGSGFRRPAPPPRGLTPLLRLLALIAFVIAILVFFGLLIQSCASTSKHDTYKSYTDKVATVARSSAADGAAVAGALTTPGVKVADLEAKLAGIAEHERQNVSAAQRLDPPGRLRDENQQLIEALELRVSGTQGLADSFRTTASSKSTVAAPALAEQADRLLASDIVWDDLFLGPATQELKAQGVSGVAVPESHYLTNRDLITPHSMALVLQRLRGATTTGTPTGLHGTNIVNVKALPGGTTLAETQLNTVTATSDLSFVVTIADSGNFQEVGIKVTLTIEQSPAIVKTQTVDLIDPGQQKAVTFTNIGRVRFASQEKVNVDVAPVRGEHDVNNNKASFPVIFSLG